MKKLVSFISSSNRAARRRLARCAVSALLTTAIFALTTAILAPAALAQKLGGDLPTSSSSADPVYPLKASANNRYLVDQLNRPFLLVGDSPQHLITNLSPEGAAAFMADRQRYGINALWIDLLCIFTEASCNRDAKTYDGIEPFLHPGDISTPNPAYFQRADDMIHIAADHGMVVLLDPIETVSWLKVLRKNGESKAFEYGKYLGNRFKDDPNVIWLHGNDLQSWRNASDDNLVQAVARGIRSADANHIHTVELNYETSGSLEDSSWAPLIELDAAYSYYPTYAQVLTEYDRKNFKPVFMVEANYEFENLETGSGGSAQNLRRQEYWTMLSGAAGQLYGSRYTWQLEEGWEKKLDTPGAAQLRYMRDLFVSRDWFDLIPDQNHVVLTAGYDRFSCGIGQFAAYIGRDRSSLLARMYNRIRKYWGVGSISRNTCTTAARTSDGSLVIAYMPTARPVTIDMSKLSGTATARWYGPTSDEYEDAKGSPFANNGSKEFIPPRPNKSGDPDWVLVLEAHQRSSQGNLSGWPPTAAPPISRHG
ncbi:MAG: DUF4038 domain-containing protein [Bradyrhizobium sp.]|nr:DUF4038 domain-containing protein [Bradyrhizobium sp.]